MASFLILKTRHFGTRLFWYPLGRPFSSTQRGVKTDGFQNGRCSEFRKLGILVPVCFDTRLGSSMFQTFSDLFWISAQRAARETPVGFQPESLFSFFGK